MIEEKIIDLSNAKSIEFLSSGSIRTVLIKCENGKTYKIPSFYAKNNNDFGGIYNIGKGNLELKLNIAGTVLCRATGDDIQEY